MSDLVRQFTNHRDYDKSLDQDKIQQVRADKIAECRQFFDEWVASNNPEISTDGYLAGHDYKAARLYVAQRASLYLGFPVTTGAVKHWIPRWGYYHTPGQKVRRDALANKTENDPD